MEIRWIRIRIRIRSTGWTSSSSKTAAPSSSR
jgi:hypothetical protein